jgi:hypothetical protein
LSQHDFTIDNQGFPAFRSDLNNALQALGSTSSGASAPSSPFANQLWYDTTNNILKIRNEDNDAWISIVTLDQSADVTSGVGAKTLPTGDIVGTSDSQTLTNKTINATQLVDASVSPAKLSSAAQYTGLKNRIINGAMVIDQRNAGASVTPTNGQYTLDRFAISIGGGETGKLSIQQNAGSVTPPAGFTNYLGVTSLSAYTVPTANWFSLLHEIEGLNVGDLAWGTANAKTITLSFWVRSSGLTYPATFGGALNNSGNSRNYPYTYTISSANTWEQKSITIAGDTSGTWLTNNGIGIQVGFALGAGTTESGTAGAWTATRAFSATGATSVVGTNGATFYITGVQLEVGSTATSFDYRPYTTELQLCQRYYAKTFPQTVAPANGLGTSYYFGYSVNTINPSTIWKFPVTMRASPAVTLFNDRVGGTAGQWNTATIDSANARALGSSTEFVMIDNSAVPLGTTTNWWLGGATAAIEL